MNTEPMIHVVPYAVQVIMLILCIRWIWQARRLLNGFARGLIVLLVFLIVQRMDFAFDIYDEHVSIIVSSLVVLAVAYDIRHVYKMLPVYEMYLKNRKVRIEEIEQMRADSENGMPWDKQPVSRV